MVKLSICITTYNQIDLLKENLDEISKYKGNDIEVVISDNCSEDDIRGLVESYNDNRFHHYVNLKNEGQDGNILFGISKCTGEFVFLFRTRDCIIANKIPEVIQTIDLHPGASYFLFSSLDENGEVRLSYSNHTYSRYNDAIIAHSRLLVHPSGQVYRRKDLRLDLYRKYISNHFSNRLSFIAHQLIRMDLSVSGDFVTSNLFAWKYTDSNKVKTVSRIVENTKNKTINVHASIYHIPRFECEFDFAYNEIAAPYNVLLIKKVISSYYIFNVISFPEYNLDPNFNRHYNSDTVKISRLYEDKKFYDAAKKMISKTECSNELTSALNSTRLKILLFHLPRSLFYTIPRNKLHRLLSNSTHKYN